MAADEEVVVAIDAEGDFLPLDLGVAGAVLDMDPLEDVVGAGDL